MKTHRIASRLQILGVGSDKNRRMKAHLQEALRQLSLNLAIEEIHDLERMLEHGIVGIPALLVNGKAVFQQEVPSVADLKVALQALLGQERMLGSVEKVVVPVDFSPSSRNALDFGLSLATVQGLPLEMVYVLSPHRNGSEGFHPEGPQRALDGLADEIREAMDDPDAAPPPISGKVLRGPVAVELLGLAEAGNALFVMGTKGSTNPEHLWMGSVSYQVAQRAPCPVMLIPEQCPYRGFRTMVYASGYHPAEESVLPQVVDLATWFKARLFFVHVSGQALDSFALRLSDDAPEPAQGSRAVEMATVYREDVVEGLLGYTREVGGDLLIMTSSRRNLLHRFSAPSHTRDVVLHLDVPLLIFPV